MKILIIEDDQLVADALVELLTRQTYAVEVAESGILGWELLIAYEYDLVILDLTLPQTDGIALCKRLRDRGSQVPVLMLTGRNDNHDKAIGLDAGADDYVVKPFDPEELLARVRALLRRSGETAHHMKLQWGDLQLDPSSCQVTYRDQLVPLTPKEYALTELFLRYPKRVFSCSAILDHLWAYEEAPGEEAVRTHIKGLRQKLRAASAGQDMVETVYGIGYRLKPSEMTQSAAAAGLSVETVTQMQGTLQRIWHDAQPRIQQQLTAIQKALIAAANDAPTLLELMSVAIREAHTLAGALGTFGLPQGSALARTIETQLKASPPFSETQLAQLRHNLATLTAEISRATQLPSAAADLSPSAAVSGDRLPSSQLDRPMLLVVDPNTRLIKQLLKDPIFQTFHIELTKRLNHATARIRHQLPDVMLFDPDVATDLSQGIAFLKQMHQEFPSLPIVIFTAHTALLERQNLLRSGGSVFLAKPADSKQILDAVEQALERIGQVQSRVLVVDDDPTILTLTQHLLQPWGLHITTLADPQQFWSVLESVRPHLLILDILMPHVNGLELCAMVRNDARWSDLPIVILTADKDSETVNQVFRLGADDFVAKPIVGPELVTRVINRLERMKLIQHRHLSA